MSKKPRKPVLPKGRGEPGSTRVQVPARVKAKKYRTKEFIPYIMRAEIGIHEAATMEPSIDDTMVRRAINSLIGQLQRGQEIVSDPGGAKDEMGLIEWRVRSNLVMAFEEHGPIPHTDLIGCLKVILESIDTWSGRPLGKRGYLNYLAGFMRQLGVRVRKLSYKEAVAEGLVEPVEQVKRPDLTQMSLEELGRFWLAHDEEFVDLIDEFSNRASYEVRMGHAEQVVQVCRSLLGKTKDPEQQAELYYNIGVALRHTGELEASVEALQNAVELVDGFYGAMIELGQSYFEQGNYRAALDIWLQEQSESGNITTLRDIARAYRKLGDISAEERALRKFVDHSSSGITGLAELADCLRRQGKEDEASLIVRRIVATIPDRRDFFEDWAYWLYYRLTMPHLPHAEDDLLQALDQIESGRQTGWPHLLKAIVYQASGDLAASERELELAYQQVRWPVDWENQLELLAHLFPTFQFHPSKPSTQVVQPAKSGKISFLQRLFGVKKDSR